MNPSNEQELVSEIITGCHLNGIIRRDAQETVVTIPITAGPSEFPKAQFYEAVNTMPQFNLMVDQLASSPEFMQLVRQELGSSDEFMNRLFEVYEAAEKSQYKCMLVAGLNRNDFLFDKNAQHLFQVEMNTLSCSFGGLSQRVTELFQALHPESKVPTNTSLDKTVEFVRLVVDSYCKHYQREDAKCVLMLVQPNERNIFDQKFVEHALLRSGIRVVRKTFDEVANALSIDHKDGTLVLDNQPIAAVYYRAGYDPSDYATAEAACVKIPNVSYQIIGKKIVQMLLKRGDVFERFLPGKEFAKLTSFFTGVYCTEDDEVVKRAIANPERFVLKPQRDGGGHNVFGAEIATELCNPAFNKRAYILMDIIDGLRVKNTLVKSATQFITNATCISELGIFGGFLKVVQGDKVLCNESLGYLLRTKDERSKESGIVAGFGYLDAPNLVE